MSDLYAYQRATIFRATVYLGGLGIQPKVEHPTGEAAERDAVTRIREHEAQISRRSVMASSFGHVEYVIPDGPEKGKVSTYARFNEHERHHVTRYANEDVPGGVAFQCSCGAVRVSEAEVNLHEEIAGNCAYCWGEEDVHPVVKGRLSRDAWRRCPACNGTGNYVPEADRPEFDTAVFMPDHASYTPGKRPPGPF